MVHMQPVRVGIVVPEAIAQVYEHLDVMANHEGFTDHVMFDWECSGPPRGVGSKARVKVREGARRTIVDIEVVDADPPRRIVERNVGAGGRRRGRGTYELTALPDGGTRIEFEYAWERARIGERILAPLIRHGIRRANERAMARLAEQLPPPAEAAATAGADEQRGA